MPKKSKLPLPEDDDEFEDDDPSDIPDGGDGALTTTHDDPEGSEFLDAVGTAPAASGFGLGVQSVLHQELEAQQSEEEAATLEALDAMRALDHGELIEWKISRTAEDDEQYNGYLVTWSNSQMTLERVKRLLGGGKYQCKGFRRGKYFTHKTIKIAGPPLIKKGEKVTEGSNGGGDMQAFIQQMMMMDDRRRQEEREYRRQQQEIEERRAASRQQLILAALGPASAVLAAMFQGNKTDLGPILAALKPPDPMQQLAALKALMPEPSAPPPSALDAAFTLVDKLKDMGGLGNSDGQTGWMDIVKEVVKAAGPSVGAVIEGAVQTAQAQAAERARAQQNGNVVMEYPNPESSMPSGSVALAAPASQPQENQEMLGLLKHLPWLRGQVNRWVLAAEKNANPQLYAQVFVADSPKDLEAADVMTLLSREDWLQQLMSLDRRVAQHQSWFVQLHRFLVHILQTEFLSAGAVTDEPVSASTGEPAASAPAPRRVVSGEVDRPMKIPSLTGD